MLVFITILNSVSVYTDGFWLYMDKTELLKLTTESTIRCDTGGHQPQHCSTEFKTAVYIVFQHCSEFLTKPTLL